MKLSVSAAARQYFLIFAMTICLGLSACSSSEPEPSTESPLLSPSQSLSSSPQSVRLAADTQVPDPGTITLTLPKETIALLDHTASTSPHPLLVEFESSSNALCLQVSPLLHALVNGKYQNQVRFIDMDISHNGVDAQMFGVGGVPVILVINPQSGKTVQLQPIANSAQLEAQVSSALQTVTNAPKPIASGEAPPLKPVEASQNEPVQYPSSDTQIVKVNGHYTIIKSKS